LSPSALFIFKSLIIESTATIFFPIPSISVNSTSGNNIANGTPGKPPPVPTSRTFVSFLNLINFNIEIECRT